MEHKGQREGDKADVKASWGLGSDRTGMGRVTKTCRQKAGDLVPDTDGGMATRWGVQS